MMKDQPFTVSPSAAAFIEKELGAAGGDPELAGLVPALVFAINDTGWTGVKGIIEHISVGYFLVGWYDAHQVSDLDRFNVAGAELAIHPVTLDKLRGSNLELEETPKKWGVSRRLVARKY